MPKTLNKKEWVKLRGTLPALEGEQILFKDKDKGKSLIFKWRFVGYFDEIVASNCYWVIKKDKVSVFTDVNEAMAWYCEY